MSSLTKRYQKVREQTEAICRPLQIEDYVVQSMADVSPAKWHLAHTTWFFETFILQKFNPSFRSYDDSFSQLFNSYYKTVGSHWEQSRRGLLSRPTVTEIYNYRKTIDEHIMDLMATIHPDSQGYLELAKLIEIGCHHEQQHQELLVTDIKHVLFQNPVQPAYHTISINSAKQSHIKPAMICLDEGLYLVGADGDGFAFDNEFPRHKTFVPSFHLSTGLVTNRDYLAFMNDGGYLNPRLWLSDGWVTVQKEGWHSPLYWQKNDNEWFVYTLMGLKKLDLDEPVCHVSYYEADAFARWAQKRLPTEFEWEIAARLSDQLETKVASSLDQTATTKGGQKLHYSKNHNEANFLETGLFHPVGHTADPSRLSPSFQHLLGNVWEWTSSAYGPYPGYQQPEGAIGEYNGKFMCNQMVLRGGSCATSQSHIRQSYRNFFYPQKRWQYSGIRLAESK